MTKLSFFSILLFLLVACKKEKKDLLPQVAEQGNNLKQKIITAPVEEQRAYVTSNLKLIASTLAPLTNNLGFKAFVRNKTNANTEGEGCVLIKTLLGDPSFNSFLYNYNIQKALSAFTEIEDKNYYPQIYIPRQTGIESNSETIYVILFDGDESKKEYPEYKFTKDGNLVPINTLISEEFAKENEVWIFSLNESVDNNGVYQNSIPSIANQLPGIEANINFRIEYFRPKTRKEGWVAGGSEVHVRAWVTTWNSRLFGEPTGSQFTGACPRFSTDFQGYKIRDILRSDIGNIYYPYFMMHENWGTDNYYQDPIAYVYSIFEYDAWPAGTKTVAIPLLSLANTPGDPYYNQFLTFGSSDSDYSSGSVYGNMSNLPGAGVLFPIPSPGQYFVDNGEIRFEFKTY